MILLGCCIYFFSRANMPRVQVKFKQNNYICSFQNLFCLQTFRYMNYTPPRNPEVLGHKNLFLCCN